MNNIEIISTERESKDNRNYGMDLLRIISMLFVVGLHFNQNCCFENITELNFNYIWVWASEAICYTSVDIFVLITGFLRGGQSQPSIYTQKSRLRLYGIIFSVWFYSITFLGIAFISGMSTDASILSSIIPLTSGSYWFISTYLLMMIMEPILMLIIESNWFNRIYISLMVMFCIIPTLFPVAGLDLKPGGGRYSLVLYTVPERICAKKYLFKDK